MNMKRLIILLFSVLTVISAVYVFIISSKKNTPEPMPSQQFVVPPPPAISFVPNAPDNVVFSIDPNSSFSLPDSLPAVSVTQINSGPYVQSFTAKIGAPEPTQVSVAGGINTYWNTENYSVSYSEKDHASTMAFHHNTGFPTGQTNKEDASIFFLRQVLGNDLAGSFVLLKQKNIPASYGEGGVDQETTQFQYSQTIHDIPVLVTNFDPTSVVVLVNNNNEIVSSSMTFPLRVVSSGDIVPMATVDSVLNNLNNGKGLLLSSYDSPDDGFGSTPEFSSVVISTITPVYYYDNVQSLIPAYIIGGKGTSNQKQQTVQYFLYAFEDPSGL